MADNQFAFDLDFAYDDVTQGLKAIEYQGKSVMDIFLKMADQIAAATTKIGQSGKQSVDPLSALGQAVERVFKGVNSSLQMMERQVRQIDMSSLEKSADKYGEKIKESQKALADLYVESKKINATDEEKLVILGRIADAQAKISEMKKAQSQIQTLAQQVKDEENLANLQKKSAEQAKRDAKELAEIQRQVDKESEDRLAQLAAESKADLKSLTAARKEASDQAKADAKELAEIQRQVDRESEARLKALAAESKAQDKANADALKQSALEAADALKKLEQEEAAAARQGRELASSQQQARQALVSLASEVRGPAVALAASLDLLVGSSFKQFMGLSDEMATFKAVAHASGDEVNYMVKAAKGLEGIPTEQAAKAAVALGRAGINAREAADDLGILSKAAIASGESLETVSTIALSTNRAFGQSNAELGKTTDVIVATANATSTSVAEVGAGMSQMASASHATNQDLLAIATAFGIVRDAGVSVESSATGIKNALLVMANPSEKARKELNLLAHSANGVKEIFQENGHIKDFASVMVDLKHRIEGLNDAAKVEALAKIFDKRSLNVVLSYMNQTDEKIFETTESIKKWQGESERTAKIMEESMGFQFRALTKDFENFKDGLGEDAAPVLKGFIDLLRGLLHAYEDLSKPMKAVIANGVLIVAGITSLIGFASQMVITIGGAIFAWNQYTAAAGRAALANATVGSSAKVAEKGLIEAALAAKGLSAISYVAMTAGIAAVAAEIWLLVDAYNAWQKAEEGLDESRRTKQSADDRTKGALNAAMQLPSDKVTGVQANRAAVDAANRVNQTKEQIAALKELKETFYTDNNAEILPDSMMNDTLDKLNTLRETLKGIIPEEGTIDFGFIQKNLEARLSSYQSEKTKYSGLNVALNGVNGPAAAEAGNLTGTEDAPTADEKVNKIIQLIDARFDKKLNDEILAAKQNKPHDENVNLTADPNAAPGPMISPFGMRIHPIYGTPKMHTGIDYGASTGTPIKSDVSGKIAATLSAADSGGYGKLMVVDAGNGNYFFYAHTSEFYKKMGDVVKKGETIAAVGSTGNVTGPHLHKEQRFGASGVTGGDIFGLTPINPLTGRQTKLSSGPTSEEIEASLKIANVEQRITELKKEQAKYGSDSNEYKTIGLEITRRESELSKARGDSVDAGNKAEKARAAEQKRLEAERIANEKKVAEDLNRIREQNTSAAIALMEDGAAKTEAKRKQEVEKVQDSLNKELIDFKGTDEQRTQFKEDHEKQIALINAKYAKEQIENQEKHAKAIRAIDNDIQQGRIDAMADGIDKQQAQIELDLIKKLDAYNDQKRELLKNAKEHKDEISAIDALETQAGIDASKKLKEAVIQNEAEKAQAKKEFLKQSLDADQQAFDAALDQMIASKRKVGIGPSKVVGSLQQSESASLAESLGQSSANDVLANLREQKRVTEEIQIAEEKKQAQLSTTSKDYAASVKNILALQKERALIEDKINVLSDEGFRKWLKGYQDIKIKTEEMNREHERLGIVLDVVTRAAQGIASVFGDMGQNIATGIGVASGALQTVMSIKDRMDSTATKPGESILDKFFGDIKNVKDAVSLITTAVSFVWDLVSGLVKANAETQKAILSAANSRIDYNSEKSLGDFQKYIDSLKRMGKSAFDEESIQSEHIMESKLDKLYRNKFKDIGEGKLGLVGANASEDKKMFESGAYVDPKLMPKVKAYIDEINRAIEENEKNQAQIKKDARDKRLAEESEADTKHMDLKVSNAKLTKDKLIEANANNDAALLAIDQKYNEEFKRATEKGIVDQSEIIQRRLNERELQEMAHTQNLRDIASDSARADTAAMVSHQEMLLSKQDEGYQKSRAMAILARDKEGLDLAADLMRLEKGTKEYDRLNQLKADNWIKHNKEISRSDEETARQRAKDLNNYRGQAALAASGLTKSNLDNTIIGGQNALVQSLMDEAEARRSAIANYGQDEQMLTAIKQSFAAQRAKIEKDTQIQAFEDIRKDYEDLEQGLLTNQLHPLQMILDKENERVKTLQRANEELQHSLDLIDKRYEKENKAQDLADRGQFDQLKGKPITQAELTAGAEEIVNENLKKSKETGKVIITDRTSKETQLRGLSVMLARQAQDAETKRKNEGYDATDTRLNDQGFVSEMSQILGRQAAVIEAQKTLAKNAKEKSDLDAAGSDLYVKYQELQKRALANKQALEKQGLEDQKNINDEQIDSGWKLVNDTQNQMNDLQKIYDTKLKSVSDAFLAAGGSSDILLSKLKQWAPELAASSIAALNYVNNIKTALGMPIAGSPAGNLPGSPTYTGPTRQNYKGNGFIIEGNDGYFYRTTSEMDTAFQPKKLAAGGEFEIPPGFENDNFPLARGIKGQSGERINVMPSAMNMQLKSFLTRELSRPQGPQVIDNSVHIGRVDSNADIDRLQSMLTANGRGNSGVKTYGINAVSRH